ASVADFPLTPNGKIDRKALPAPGRLAVERQGTIVAPRNDAERDLTALWEDVLKVKPISVTDNFFELGGTSVLAAVLTTPIQKHPGHRLILDALLKAPREE